MKARGTGFSQALDRFDVSLIPGEPAALLHVEDDPAEVARWSMQALAPAPEYVGALVVEGHDLQLICGEWVAGD